MYHKAGTDFRRFNFKVNFRFLPDTFLVEICFLIFPLGLSQWVEWNKKMESKKHGSKTNPKSIFFFKKLALKKRSIHLLSIFWCTTGSHEEWLHNWYFFFLFCFICKILSYIFCFSLLSKLIIHFLFLFLFVLLKMLWCFAMYIRI